MTGNERLKLLEQKLRTLNPLKENLQFHMGHWYQELENFSPSEGEECGTVACAAGYACTIPELKAEGLGLSGDSGYSSTKQFCPSFQGTHRWTALSKFFKLTNAETQWLFNGGSYKKHTDEITPLEVADRIKKITGMPSLIRNMWNLAI